MNIFLSYRREDSAAITGRIYDRLSNQFGRAAIFMDVDAIPLGVDFRQHIREAVSQCQILLAVIGSSWNGFLNDQKRRLDNPGDFVRLELETALAKGIPVFPLLVGQTPMPSAHELPESLADLTYRNAANVDVGKDFHAHMDRLIRHLETLMPTASPKATPGPPVHPAGDPGWTMTGNLNAYIALAVEHPNEKLQTLMFDASQDRRIILGRASTCDVCLPMSDISRKHAMILYDLPRGWVLQDLQTHRGVFLNGSPVKETPLKAGDRIQMGSAVISVKMAFP